LIITVGPPWFISSVLDCIGWLQPDAAPEPQGCREFSMYGPAVIWTDEPNAPSRNIVISAASAGQHCP
jgi:hypothetical protein